MLIFQIKKALYLPEKFQNAAPNRATTQVKKYFHYSLSNYYLVFLCANTIL